MKPVRFETIDTIELKDKKYLIKFMNINSKEEAQQMINAHIMIAEEYASSCGRRRVLSSTISRL